MHGETVKFDQLLRSAGYSVSQIQYGKLGLSGHDKRIAANYRGTYVEPPEKNWI
jgi:hypothetical protein